MMFREAVVMVSLDVQILTIKPGALLFRPKRTTLSMSRVSSLGRANGAICLHGALSFFISAAAQT